MYIGVLPRTSKVTLWLRPIRAELSIVAWILTLGQALDLLIKRGVGCAVVTLGAGGSAAREGTRLYRAPAASAALGFEG